MASAAKIAMQHNDRQTKILLAKLRKLGGAVQAQKAMIDAGNEAIRLMVPRIQSGKNARGREMPDYSKKPAYFAKKTGVKTALNKVANQGKRPDSGKKFKNGKLRRSVYMPDGYYQLRQVTGRGTNKNRLDFTGKMLNNMAVKTYGRNGVAIQFPRRSEDLKARGNQDKYEFFGLTPAERAAVKRVAINEINYQIQKAVS